MFLTSATIPHAIMQNGTVLDVADMEVLWAGDEGAPTEYPCVDCGLMTGNFCDGGMSVAYDKCFAAERVPRDFNMRGSMRTPLCSYCESFHDVCRFCRGVYSCTPPERKKHWSGVPQSESRRFNKTVADAARARLAAKCETNERARVPG